MFKNSVFTCCFFILIACSSDKQNDSINQQSAIKPTESSNSDSLVTNELINNKVSCTNDSLNALANIIAGINDDFANYSFIQNQKDFKLFSTNFNKRWLVFDSSRLANLTSFTENELSKLVKQETTLFYPFSGPDILHAQTFFPEASQYVMIGLEPVGSLPNFSKDEIDSTKNYFNKINTSLNAILKFSFFRTESMSKDLKNQEVDGTLHLLVLFLKRTGNQLCEIKPVTVDTLGNISYVDSFENLKKLKTLTRGVEIQFTDTKQSAKKLYYFSVNAFDGSLKNNIGFKKYLNELGVVTTYLKGASYLMHKSYFSIIRDYILNHSSQVIQDDSGIAFHYFKESNAKWDYAFYGQYLKPIPMFKEFYQKDLDSLYKQQGSKPMGFGIGYNFKDKNSNFMIATKQK